MEIGKKIREERKKRNLQQQELAKMADISNTYLSDIEVGRTTPSIKTLMKISKALGVDCSIFLDEDKEKG
ncbi:helix-turn-helix domain-containing protein [Paramaledivibacter caminithermalis]|jgi:transcriptional regulator with XRE-family HTH domain|uniref:DNA-binding transcriptional regulator, XRE-family HTH domain n=1 Tax=Paramaledivibacter caminithermalis (strain DSM 15212 / CIP 107654 / DViRD3) TaxID=1121301 RepID=A0A1M6NB38_PARC5|nr:helix-turn-helix transcriptional regulator [Paramaledivibacter caminithermalis]SHJ92867.1 DNA-binding transcriptional regulator, XRE-family HTH domain [Paramaledivibacter caminithermalis DSM 15212]